MKGSGDYKNIDGIVVFTSVRLRETINEFQVLVNDLVIMRTKSEAVAEHYYSIYESMVRQQEIRRRGRVHRRGRRVLNER